jgi:pre-mRNA-splicing factor ATP-dependent RNA helicase DHX38/PRP16
MPSGPSGSNVISSKDNDNKPAGLGDFQSRLNRNTYDDRDRDRGYSRDDRKNWNDAPTPKSVKGESDWDGGSMRVPNRGWDETPRGARDAGRYGKSDGSKGRGWDETPRSVRVKKEFPDLEDGEAMAMNGTEWEEEQVRLDRDWYSYDDEGAVVCTSLGASQF